MAPPSTVEPMARVGAVSGYTLADLQTLLGLPPARVREWMRAGFLEPRPGADGEPRFSFLDLVLLRAAKGLAETGVTGRRVRQALAGLRETLPLGRPLAALRISAEDGRIVVRDGGEAWDPVSGQSVLDFHVADLARDARPLAERAAAAALESAEELSADDWYELGLELEAAAPAEARDAYRRALAADAHFNLAGIYEKRGEKALALRHLKTCRELARRPG